MEDQEEQIVCMGEEVKFNHYTLKSTHQPVCSQMRVSGWYPDPRSENNRTFL